MDSPLPKQVTSSKLLHDVVSNASTILSISQMAMYSHDMSEELQADLERIMETSHEIVSNIEQLGEILDQAGIS